MTPDEIEEYRRLLHGDNPPPNLNIQAPNTNVQVPPPPAIAPSIISGLSRHLRRPLRREQGPINLAPPPQPYQYQPDSVFDQPVPNALGPQSRQEAQDYTGQAIRDTLLSLTPYGAGRDLAEGVVERSLPHFLGGVGGLMLSTAPFLSPRRLMMTDQILRELPRGPNRQAPSLTGARLNRDAPTVRESPSATPPSSTVDNITSLNERRFPPLENQPMGYERARVQALELQAVENALRAPDIANVPGLRQYLIGQQARLEDALRMYQRQVQEAPLTNTMSPYNRAIQDQQVQRAVEDTARFRRGQLKTIEGGKPPERQHHQPFTNPAQQLLTPGATPFDRGARPGNFERFNFVPLRSGELSGRQATNLVRLRDWLTEANVPHRLTHTKDGTVYVYAYHPHTNDIINIRISKDGHYAVHEGAGRAVNNEYGLENLFDTGYTTGRSSVENPNISRNISGQPYSERSVLEDALSHRLSASPSGQWLVPPGRERVYPAPRGISPPMTEPGFLQRGRFVSKTENLKFPDSFPTRGKIEAMPTQLDLFEAPKRAKLTLGSRQGMARSRVKSLLGDPFKNKSNGSTLRSRAIALNDRGLTAEEIARDLNTISNRHAKRVALRNRGMLDSDIDARLIVTTEEVKQLLESRNLTRQVNQPNFQQARADRERISARTPNVGIGKIGQRDLNLELPPQQAPRDPTKPSKLPTRKLQSGLAERVNQAEMFGATEMAPLSKFRGRQGMASDRVGATRGQRLTSRELDTQRDATTGKIKYNQAGRVNAVKDWLDGNNIPYKIYYSNDNTVYLRFKGPRRISDTNLKVEPHVQVRIPANGHVGLSRQARERNLQGKTVDFTDAPHNTFDLGLPTHTSGLRATEQAMTRNVSGELYGNDLNLLFSALKHRLFGDKSGGVARFPAYGSTYHRDIVPNVSGQLELKGGGARRTAVEPLIGVQSPLKIPIESLGQKSLKFHHSASNFMPGFGPERRTRYAGLQIPAVPDTFKGVTNQPTAYARPLKDLDGRVVENPKTLANRVEALYRSGGNTNIASISRTLNMPEAFVRRIVTNMPEYVQSVRGRPMANPEYNTVEGRKALQERVVNLRKEQKSMSEIASITGVSQKAISDMLISKPGHFKLSRHGTVTYRKELQADIYKMMDEGMGPAEIARKLGRTATNISTIMVARKIKEAPRDLLDGLARRYNNGVDMAEIVDFVQQFKGYNMRNAQRLIDRLEREGRISLKQRQQAVDNGKKKD